MGRGFSHLHRLLLALIIVTSTASGSDRADTDEVSQDAESSRSTPSDPTSRVLGDQATGFAKRGIGLLGTASLGPDQSVGGGAAVQVRSVALLFGPVVSARYLDRLWLGADSRGLTYSLHAQGAIGARWKLPGDQGPFARVEFRGELSRRNGRYHSSLRVPGLQVGWGLDQGPWLIDLSAHGSPALTGRLRTRGHEQRVQGWFMGGAGSIGWNNLLLHSDASRLLADDPLWDVRNSLCSYWLKKPTTQIGSSVPSKSVGPRSTNYSLGVCTEANTLAFPSKYADIPIQFDVGLIILVGSFSRLDRSPGL